MNLKGKKIGLVSPGGEIRAYFNAGVLGELMQRGLNVSRISGTSGGIMCLLPYFQSRDFQDYEAKVRASIRRELISTDWLREIGEFFKKRIFHYNLRMDFEVDIEIDPEFIREEYLAENEISLKRMNETDVIVSVTAVRDGYPIESRRFNICDFCLKEKEAGKIKASKLIQAAATIFSKSDPVEWEENNEKMFLLDGFYADNLPMSEMFDDYEYKKENEVDVILIINNSNLKNYRYLIEQIQKMKKEFFGLNRYSLNYKSLVRYAEMSLSISGNDKEQVDNSILVNQMLRERLRKEGRDPEKEYGKPIHLSEYDSKAYTLKPFFVIEPENNKQDIQLLSSDKDKESVAEKNYFLGRQEAQRILDLIESGKIKPY